MESVYDQIRRAIKKSGRSRYSLAKETEVSQSHLSQFMDGKRGLSIESIEKLIAALKLEIILRPIGRQKGR